MRSPFGRFAVELRARKKLSQSEFAEKVEIALARVSNLEHSRTAISDDVLRRYIKVLDCSGDEAHQLRKLAQYSEALRVEPEPLSTSSKLRALLSSHGKALSPSAFSRIQQIIEAETGESLAAMQFSFAERKHGTPNKRRERPSLTPELFAEIVIQAGFVRRDLASTTEKIHIGRALEQLCAASEKLDTLFVDSLPSFLDGAFACIVGDCDGYTLLLESERMMSADRGVHFARHVICHELGHHFRHPHLLTSTERIYIAPQELSKNSAGLIGTDRMRQQVVASIEEVEAECFSTFLLVPWEAFLKGTIPSYLASDFGEQQREIERYFPYFKQPAVLDAIKRKLWEMGERSHPVFHN